jgi:hypothetical protein
MEKGLFFGVGLAGLNDVRISRYRPPRGRQKPKCPNPSPDYPNEYPHIKDLGTVDHIDDLVEHLKDSSLKFYRYHPNFAGVLRGAFEELSNYRNEKIQAALPPRHVAVRVDALRKASMYLERMEDIQREKMPDADLNMLEVFGRLRPPSVRAASPACAGP